MTANVSQDTLGNTVTKEVHQSICQLIVITYLNVKSCTNSVISSLLHCELFFSLS